MILVFGGTTEGRNAAQVLEEAATSYFYSTKTGEQNISLHHGQRIDGAMDAEAMLSFCKQHEIRLIVNAAHPFATQLHKIIAETAASIRIPVIRYERIYPPRDPDITWIDDYKDIPADSLQGLTLLATTGVQSISKLKWLETAGVKVIYRILNRESSIRLAHQQGASDSQIVYYEGNHPLNQGTDADAILLKESGLSGGFVEKVEEAKAKGMRIIVLKRPEITHGSFPVNQGDGLAHSGEFFPCSVVNGPFGLRRAIEKLLPEFFPLHSGLTTGTCATAAAIAATLRLIRGETPDEVPVILPNGETITVPVGFADGYAYCIKEAGDDPDVTNGIEVRAAVNYGDRNNDSSEAKDQSSCPHDSKVEAPRKPKIEILGGEGVGRFTLPGFDYPPGEAAINKAPREMIRNNIERVINDLSITISVPNGEEIAKRTFNPRLGIEGGISIIGVSGIVKPFSEEAFVDSIRKCMNVAKASGTDRVVINSGGKSERFVKTMYPELPKQAFVEYGNYIGETLRMAAELGIPNVTLGVMLGKAVKLAEGHLDTHSRKATMNKTFVEQLLREADCDISLDDITLARELWQRIPSGRLDAFVHTVIRHCYDYCQPLLPNGSLTILLIDDEGKIYS